MAHSNVNPKSVLLAETLHSLASMTATVVLSQHHLSVAVFASAQGNHGRHGAQQGSLNPAVSGCEKHRARWGFQDGQCLPDRYR